MLEPSRPKKPPRDKNQIQTNNKEFSSAPSSPSPSPIFSTPCLLGKDKDIEMEEAEEITGPGPVLTKKRGCPQSTPGKQELRQRKKAKPRPTTASKRFPIVATLRQHLHNALESLNQAYIGLEEEGETKEQINKLKNYKQCIILGENPFLQETEKQEKDVLKGLVEEVKALHKEVAPTKETYAERLKQGLSSSSYSPSSLPLPSAPTSSTSSTSSTSPPPLTSTRSKKKAAIRKGLSPNYRPKRPTFRCLLHMK